MSLAGHQPGIRPGPGGGNDAHLVIPMRWLPSEPIRVVDVDEPPADEVASVADTDPWRRHARDDRDDRHDRGPVAAARTDAPAVPPLLHDVAPHQRPMPPQPGAGSGVPAALAGWAHVVATSVDACLLVDARGRMVAVSAAAAQLLADATPDEMVGRHLLDGVLHFTDFEPASRETRGATYTDRIPPLLALASEGPARGLLRVSCRRGDVRTVDALAAPLHDGGGALAGAVAFLSAVAFS